MKEQKNIIKKKKCVEILKKLKKLIVCILISNSNNIVETSVNGNNLSLFFTNIKNTKNNNTFQYTLNDLLLTKNGKYNNTFYHYKNGNLIYDNDKKIRDIEHVIILKDIFYNKRKLNNILSNSESINKLYKNLTFDGKKKYYISFNYEGTKNLLPNKVENEYDLIDCQEYTGLEDQIKDNDKLVVNEDVNKENKSFFTYIIEVFDKYKIYVIAWIIIIVQIVLFYYLLKYVYEKWNPYDIINTN